MTDCLLGHELLSNYRIIKSYYPRIKNTHKSVFKDCLSNTCQFN